MKHYNIPIFIPHLGCPYECVYCNQKVIAAQHSIPDVHQVTQTVEKYLHTIPRSGHVEVAFFGGSFTAVNRDLQATYLRAIAPFLKSGRVKNIRVSTRPDYIDKPTLDLLASNGVKMVELGVQSLDDGVLAASSRTYSREVVCRSAELIKNFGLDLGIQLMVGLPADTYPKDLETARQVISLSPQAVRIYPTLVIAGTALADWWAEGRYDPLTLDEAVAISSDMYMLFQQAGIDVIRMGLYPGEELVGEGVIKAGPFHPSFGELVEQAVFREQIAQVLDTYGPSIKGARSFNLYIHPRDLSKAIGQRRHNLLVLSHQFNLEQLSILPYQEMVRDSVGVSGSDTDQPGYILSRPEFLAVKTKDLI